MKKIGVAIGSLGLSFLIGMFGLYTVMPYIQPERVENRENQLSSNAAADSLVRTRLEQTRSDSMKAVRNAALEVAGLTADSLDTLIAHARRLSTYEDSLQTVLQQANRHQTRSDSLRTALEELKQQAAQLETSDQTAEEISKAFTEIENNEMSQILAHVQPEVLRQLYDKASTRDRSRILRALEPEQAAQFLETMVDPQASDSAPADSGTTLAGDSTALPENNPQLR